MSRFPTIGTKDAAGADTYVAVVAAMASGQQYKHIVAHCETKAAILSFDGGVTDHVELPAAQLLVLDDVTITSVYAKNATAGQNYANLVASCW